MLLNVLNLGRIAKGSLRSPSTAAGPTGCMQWISSTTSALIFVWPVRLYVAGRLFIDVKRALCVYLFPRWHVRSADVLTSDVLCHVVPGMYVIFGIWWGVLWE